MCQQNLEFLWNHALVFNRILLKIKVEINKLYVTEFSGLITLSQIYLLLEATSGSH